MKNKFYLIFPVLVALTACQNEQATTAPHAPANTAAIAAAANHNTATASAVAVTKPVVQHNAQSLQASTIQAKQAAAKAVAQLIAPPATSQKTEVAKTIDVAKTIAATKSINTAKVIATEKATGMKKATAPAIIGNAMKGKVLARKCMTCHRFSDKRKVGPGLKAVVGRKAGIMTDTKYSTTLKAGGWVWNEQNLALWLCDSKKSVKILSGNAAAKTKMPAQRICDPRKQADIIAFMKTL